jgi:hypothetical protein
MRRDQGQPEKINSRGNSTLILDFNYSFVKFGFSQYVKLLETWESTN